MSELNVLKQRQALPLLDKILLSKRRIMDFNRQTGGKMYLAFSGGRDSTVLSHLISTALEVDGMSGGMLEETWKVPHVFNNTGVEWSNILRFVRLVGLTQEVVYLTPKYSFFEIIKKYGYPVISKEVSQYIHQITAEGCRSEKTILKRLYGSCSGESTYLSGKIPEHAFGFLKPNSPLIGDKCCFYLKKKPAADYEKLTGNRPILGIMAEESRFRHQHATKHGCIYEKTSGLVCSPIIFWTQKDIEDYIKLFNVQVCDLYDQGFERTGCIGCLYGCKTKTQADEKLKPFKEKRPKQYQWYLENGLQEVLEALEYNDSLTIQQKREIRTDFLDRKGLENVK